jgi:hypothetical protein
VHAVGILLLRGFCVGPAIRRFCGCLTGAPRGVGSYAVSIVYRDDANVTSTEE